MTNEKNILNGCDSPDQRPETGGPNSLLGANTPVRMITFSVPDMGTEKAFLFAACRAALEAYRHAHREPMTGSSAETVDGN